MEPSEPINQSTSQPVDPAGQADECRRGVMTGLAEIEMAAATDAKSQVCRRALAILVEGTEWIGGRDLAERLGLDGERDLRREVIWPLRTRYRVPVISKPGRFGGYKLRATAEEFRAAVAWHQQMGRDFMAIMAILRGEGVDVIAGQMVMEFLRAPGSQVGRPGRKDDMLSMLIDDEARRGRRVAWTDVVENLLQVMAEDPAAYAEPIARIRQRHGGLFLPADRLAELDRTLNHARELLATG